MVFRQVKRDDGILFIDARNVFTQIDRAHREFTPEQVRNLSLISQLHLGDRHEFIEAVDAYFAAGFVALAESHAPVAPLAAQLRDVLDDAEGKEAVAAMQAEWAALKPLQSRYAKYQATADASAPTEASNRAQHQRREQYDPFFAVVHTDFKRLDKHVRQHEKQLAEAAQAEGKRGGVDRDTKALKTALDALHAEVRAAEVWFGHVRWLQERFSDAAYEDVTGLCKLATPTEVAEQDYSLNVGRYVGVVIEEDGKTEEEFVAELLAMNAELAELNSGARSLAKVIDANLSSIVGAG